MSEPSRVRFTGALSSLDAVALTTLQDRAAALDLTIRDRATSILAEVRQRGDQALYDLAHRFDGVTLETLEVPRATCTRALDLLDPALRIALERAAQNIETVHRAFLPTAIEVSPEPGIVIGRRPDPLTCVGVYAPGGRAAYPSSLLMGAIPARVAGVSQVIVCSPPGPDGLPTAVVLAAATLANVSRVFAIGGAGAIGAMAYGTASVPRVDRIVGPGNAYVAAAKLQVVAHVAIDAPAGPSELLVLADDSADPECVAREMVAQAEHDPLAAVITMVYGPGANEWMPLLDNALSRALEAAPRAGIAKLALGARGAILSADTEEEAIAFANRWSPEHLLLLVREERNDALLSRVRNAGTVFIGAASSVAFGDYMTGANHVLPTAGLARSYSGLSTLDFVRWTTWQRVSPAAAGRMADDVACLADAEGLPGHATAARAWSRPSSMSARILAP